MKTYLLTTIRKEGPIHASVLRSDLRTIAKAGVDMGDLDENRVFRTLAELESEGAIRRTTEGGNEWEAVFVSEQEKPKQQLMF